MSSKYQVVPFRMSPQEKKVLKMLCREADLSMAQWMRLQIRKAHGEYLVAKVSDVAEKFAD